MSGQGIVHANRELLVRLAAMVERGLPGAEDVVDIGGGVHETRPAYRVALSRVRLRQHPTVDQHALVFLTANARTRFANILAAIQAKAANQRDADEVLTLTLPAEGALDATWDPSVTPP